MPRNARSPSIRSRGIRSSGPERFVGDVVDRAARSSRIRAASIVRPAACLWPPNADQQMRAALERAEHVEARNAAARAVRDVVLDRQHDGRPVKRVDELRRDDADDAAVPAFAGDDEHRCARRRPDRSGRSSSPRRGSRLPPPAAGRSRRRAAAPAPAPPRPSPRRSASSSRVGDVGRAHAAGGVDARRQHEADVIAVDRLAGQARRRRAARAGRPCAARASAGRARAWR